MPKDSHRRWEEGASSWHRDLHSRYITVSNFRYLIICRAAEPSALGCHPVFDKAQIWLSLSG